MFTWFVGDVIRKQRQHIYFGISIQFPTIVEKPLVVKMAKPFIIIIFFVLQSQAGRITREEDTFDFDVCPESHPYAFRHGHKCCSQQNLEKLFMPTFYARI
jgi:hypothetical protein